MEATSTNMMHMMVLMFAVMCAVFCGRMVIVGIRKRMYGQSLVIGIMAIFFVVYGFSVI